MVPKTLVDRIVVEMHGQYHAGVENTLLMIKARFYWRAMEKDVKSTVDKCRTCAQCKPRSKPQAELQEPTRSFNTLERVCIDVGTMPIPLDGNKKFLQMVDDASKFVVTAHMRDETADFIRRAIWNKWIPYFGIPMDMHSDQASNVDGTKVCELSVECWESIKLDHHLTTQRGTVLANVVSAHLRQWCLRYAIVDHCLYTNGIACWTNAH